MVATRQEPVERRQPRTKRSPIYRGVKDVVCPYCGRVLTLRRVEAGTIKASGLFTAERAWVEASCCMRRWEASSPVELKGLIDQRCRVLKGTPVWT